MLESPTTEGQSLVPLAQAAGRDLIVFDLEHTGGTHAVFGITELAFLRIKANGLCTKSASLINPGKPIPPWISAITGIWPNMVKSSPKWEAVGSPFVADNQEAVWVGFNSCSSDIKRIQSLHERDGLPALDFRYQIDVMRMAKQMGGHKGTLSVLTELHAPHAVRDAHRAYADVLMTAALLEVWMDFALDNLDQLLSPDGKIKEAGMVMR